MGYEWIILKILGDKILGVYVCVCGVMTDAVMWCRWCVDGVVLY